MNAVDVSARGARPPRGRAAVRALCLRALGAAGIDGWDLSVLLTDDEGIRALNARYRGRDRPTDVLSFPQRRSRGRAGRGTGGAAARAAGDIVLSVETLRRNAAERGIGEHEELARLLVHGILHLDGMDHGAGCGRAMFDRQRKVLARVSSWTAKDGGGAA